jgi:pimeloyl-ACP methyl ester carboxylesterase
LPASSPSSTAADGVVEIGGGRVIRVACAGFDQPGPAVVFVSGSQSAGDEWKALRGPGATGMTLADMQESPSAVFGQVTAFAPACVYDRPGTVRLDGSVTGSTPVNQPTTAMADVADLEAWLSAAQVAPPYVLVGHSWGGLIATLFAATYLSKTAGLVLVDPATVYLEDALTAEQWQQSFWASPRKTVDGLGKESP